MGLVIGVDASRNRSGGARAHLVGLFTQSDPRRYGIERVHLWAYRDLIDRIPDQPWLEKHVPEALDGSRLHQMWWQFRHLPGEARALGCQVMFNTDAGSVCPFKPDVTLSQDMLSFEPGEMRRFGVSRARVRLLLLYFIQRHSLRRARVPLFLTHYAAGMIQRATGPLPNHVVIHHGVGEEFRAAGAAHRDRSAAGEAFQIVYVSNAAMYKHQWHVVRALKQLREAGLDIRLSLVGGGGGRALALLQEEIARSDPSGAFVRQLPFVPHDKVPDFLAAADIFLFASSCENMPVTLLEAMAARLPIACSDRGPMPEILQDGGVYFDPENRGSIAQAVRSLLSDGALREKLAARAQALASQYTWRRCAEETWQVLAGVAAGTR